MLQKGIWETRGEEKCRAPSILEVVYMYIVVRLVGGAGLFFMGDGMIDGLAVGVATYVLTVSLQHRDSSFSL